MKIHPLRRYATPDYPSMATAQQVPDLLGRIPGRWQRSPGFSAMLGLVAGFTARVVLAGEPPAKGSDAKPQVQQAPATPRSAQPEAEDSHQVSRATSIVAPLLDEALKYDGRGAFGCVAINPPTFLSEDEAVELIRAELESAGLKLTEAVELGDVMAPAAGKGGLLDLSDESDDEKSGPGKARAKGRDYSRGRPAKLRPGEFTFDLADTHRQVFVEYLSVQDHGEWEGRSASTVSSYDFPALARRVTEAFGKRKAEKATVFGVFFDPLARAEVPSPEVSGLSPAQQRLAYAEYQKAIRRERAKLDDKAKEKLRKQVQHFVAFLRQEGVVARTK